MEPDHVATVVAFVAVTGPPWWIGVMIPVLWFIVPIVVFIVAVVRGWRSASRWAAVWFLSATAVECWTLAADGELTDFAAFADELRHVMVAFALPCALAVLVGGVIGSRSHPASRDNGTGS